MSSRNLTLINDSFLGFNKTSYKKKLSTFYKRMKLKIKQILKIQNSSTSVDGLAKGEHFL